MEDGKRDGHDECCDELGSLCQTHLMMHAFCCIFALFDLGDVIEKQFFQFKDRNFDS